MSVMDFGVRENVRNSPCFAEILALGHDGAFLPLNHLIYDLEASGTYEDPTLNCISKACWCYGDDVSEMPDLYTEDRDKMVAWNRFSNLANMLVGDDMLSFGYPNFPSVANIFTLDFEDNKGNMRRLADVWDEHCEYDAIEVLENWNIETYFAHLMGNVYDVPGGTMLTPTVPKCDYDDDARNDYDGDDSAIEWCVKGKCTCDHSEPCGICYLYSL